MLEAPSGKTSPLRQPGADALATLEHDLVQAVLDQQRAVVVTGKAGSGKTRLLRGVTTSLTRSAVRVVNIGSPDRLPLGLRGILDQVIDPARADGADDRVRRFCAELTQCHGGERQVALVIDDADVLTPQAIEFLGIIGGAAEPRASALHVVLVGRPHLLELLSQTSRFGPQRSATRFVLPDLAPPDLPEPQLGVDEVRRRDQALSSLWGRFDEAVAEPAPAGTALVGTVLVGTALTISRPAAEVFRFGGTLSRASVSSRARPMKWLATVLLLIAPAIGAFYGNFQFRPAAALAGFVSASGLAEIAGRFSARGESVPETVAQPSQPATVAAEPTWRATVAPASPQAPSHDATSGAAAPVPPVPRSDPIKAGYVAAAGETMPPDDARTARTPEAEPSAAASTTPPDRSIDLTAGAVGPSLGGALAVEAKAEAQANAAERPPPPVVAMPAGYAATPSLETTKPVEAAPPLPSTPPIADPPAGDPPELLAMLVSRGNALLKTGDVSGARLMYEHAARSGSRDAAVAAGRTYDPNFLDYPRGRRTTSDRQAAATWYRQALAQGDRRAAGLLAQLGGAGD